MIRNFFRKKYIILLFVTLLPIIFVLQQYISKPHYNVTGVLTVGKIFERPLIPSSQVLKEIKSYKNGKTFNNIFYDVFADDTEELFFDGTNKRYRLHNKIVIQFRGEDKNLLKKKLSELLIEIKAKHDVFFDQNINLFKTVPLNFLNVENKNLIYKNKEYGVYSTFGNFDCQYIKDLGNDTHKFDCFIKNSQKPIFSFTTTFPISLIQFYNKFRGRGPVFENHLFRKTEFLISSPVKTGMSFLKSSILTTLFLFFSLMVLYVFVRDKNDT
ncbi:hypothetical protein N9O69_03130 [Alphaproteobacteria bacterium]|nr:hypothetical protein [Alphaproteobacteria bacterium]